MAIYKSVFLSIGTPLCRNQHIFKIIKNEIKASKLEILNYNERHFTTSLVGKTRQALKNVKPSEMTQGPKQPVGGENVQPTPFSLNVLVKPFLFTVAFSSASIAGAAIWQYENMSRKLVLLMKKSWLYEKFFKYNKIWNQLTEGEKLFIPICIINVAIFLAWKVKRFQPTMIKYFCSTPYGEAVCWPMTLTTFSHYSIYHLAANMYVLYSFSTIGVAILGKEQFLGLYLAAGVISSFTSYLYKAVRLQNSLSIGASGAVMAILAFICTKHPETNVSIILLPWFVFSAGSAIKVLMAFDTLGVLRGWKYLDHATHLGGAVCGIGWTYWGNSYIWQKVKLLPHWWDEIKSQAK